MHPKGNNEQVEYRVALQIIKQCATFLNVAGKAAMKLPHRVTVTLNNKIPRYNQHIV